MSRPMLNYGSPFHRVAGVLPIGGRAPENATPLELHVRYWCDQPCDLQLRAFTDRWAADLGPLPPAAGRWADHVAVVDFAATAAPFVVQPNTSGTFGAGDIQITEVAFVDERTGGPTEMLTHGEPAVLSLRYQVTNPRLRERAQVLVVFHRDGVQDVCRILARDLPFDAARPTGTVRLRIPRVDLTDGQYSLTVMIAVEGYYDTRQTTFFAINPGVYSCLSRVFDVHVVGSGPLGEGTVTVKDGEFSIH